MKKKNVLIDVKFDSGTFVPILSDSFIYDFIIHKVQQDVPQLIYYYSDRQVLDVDKAFVFHLLL